MPVVPKLMRAAAIERFGGPEVVEIRELPVPGIGTSEVLIAMHTAGVAGWDAEMRGGWWPFGRPRFPIVLGTDGSGTVAKVGSRVRGFKPGDRVYCYCFPNPKGGCHAEYTAAPAANVGRAPASLDLEKTGAIPATGLTALQGVGRLALTRNRLRIAIIGAAGAVGSLALQFARWKGALVLAVVRGKDAVKVVKDLGANEVVDATRDDVGEAASRFAGDGGLHAVLAFAGGKSLEECAASLKAGGRIVYPNGVEPAPKKRQKIKIIVYDAEPGPAHFRRFTAAVDEAKLKVPISAAFPLAEARKAHQRVESGHRIGKVVLRIRQG
jgi:NADPH:quinone reductase-like Zn-dependent oxidoreductase